MQRVPKQVILQKLLINIDDQYEESAKALSFLPHKKV